jgi:dTDP-glucose 4,6-dehydratase
MRWLVTGGCGFIGSAVVRRLLGVDPVPDGGLRAPVDRLILLDALSYAGRVDNLGPAQRDPRLHFVHGDIADAGLVERVLAEQRPDVLLNLAAESHVDRSLSRSSPFLHTNVQGTQVLIDAWLAYGGGRFLQASTDEVYGDLDPGSFATEDFPLLPSNPYAASKAAGDMLVRAAVRSWGLDAVITRSCNNLGPHQHLEKLIPRMIVRMLNGQPLPIYGSGEDVRDWIWVHDNTEGLLRAALQGEPGRVYNLGAGQQRSNLEVVAGLRSLLGASACPIEHLPDRPGHDKRYALNSDRAASDLGWRARTGFEAALERTASWYQGHRSWWEADIEELPQESPPSQDAP